ncbi:MAG TPA: hypothetical protein VL981_14580 [Candidatus Methylacidiphilales bacterium]|nr:hypothetical protein [Candidatus Methylacidiphilales bacterium]
MSLPPAKNVASPEYEMSSARALRVLLIIIVLVLTFEGVVRKMQIPGTSVPIFLLKDVIVLIMAFHVMRMTLPRSIDFLWGAYLGLIALFVPVILVTALHDPVLALFGAKEYLLYPFVGLAVFYAYHDVGMDEIVRFFRWTSLLIIPTFIVAMIQLRLPPGHWLNLSVEGDMLDNFAAAGKLRVSSTFSFVAQYGAFLNAEFFMLIIALHQTRDLNFFWKAVYIGLIPLFVISNYVTGSRGAVDGCTAVIAIAGGLSLVKLQLRSVFRLLGIIVGLVIVVLAGQYFLPDEFAAYSERERGQLIGISSNVQQRIFDALFNWTGSIFSQPLFGNGLGVMSNGSNTFSDYASHERLVAGWTETDFATTLFEGGFYLILVWYGFRFYIIYQTLRRFLADVDERFSLPASFCQANVILLGLTATLGMQPPLAIWWWMAVGTSLLLWWKCVEPKRDETGLPIDQPAQTAKKPRGRSAYAERLHRGR